MQNKAGDIADVPSFYCHSTEKGFIAEWQKASVFVFHAEKLQHEHDKQPG